MAFLFLIPGIALIIHTGPVLLITPRLGRSRAVLTLLSPVEAHIFGWWAVAVSFILVLLYFYARWSIAREDAAPPPHFLDIE